MYTARLNIYTFKCAGESSMCCKGLRRYTQLLSDQSVHLQLNGKQGQSRNNLNFIRSAWWQFQVVRNVEGSAPAELDTILSIETRHCTGVLPCIMWLQRYLHEDKWSLTRRNRPRTRDHTEVAFIILRGLNEATIGRWFSISAYHEYHSQKYALHEAGCL